DCGTPDGSSYCAGADADAGRGAGERTEGDNWGGQKGAGMVIGVLNIGIKLVIEIGSSVVGRPRRCGGRRVVPLQFCRKGMEQEEEEKGGGLRMIRRLRMEEEEEEEEEGGR
ncbi:hypothetical protein Csa_023869, partial [Cucumis sativus]